MKKFPFNYNLNFRYLCKTQDENTRQKWMDVIELSARKLSELSKHINNNKELVDEFSVREPSETDKQTRQLSCHENNSLRASNYIVHNKTDNCEMSADKCCDVCCCYGNDVMLSGVCDVNDDDMEKRRLISTTRTKVNGNCRKIKE